MPVLTTRHRATGTAAFELLLMTAGILFVRREIWQLHVLDLTLAHFQEGVLLALAAADGAITGFYGSRLRNAEHVPTYRHLLGWGLPLFFVLYVACGALSERLNIGVFRMLPELWRCLGVMLVAGGLAFRWWAQMSAAGALAATGAPISPATTPAAEPQTATTDAVPGAPPTDRQTAAQDAQSAEGAEPGGAAKTAPYTLLSCGPHRLLRYPDAAGRLIALCGIPLCFNAWLPLLALPGILTLLKWHISDQEAFRISQLGEPYLEYRKTTWNLIPYIY